MRSVSEIVTPRSVLSVPAVARQAESAKDAVILREGSDAAITGQTRSLGRRLLGLNLRSMGAVGERTLPATAANTLKVA